MKKILVVDDYCDNRDVISQILEDTAEIITAESGAKAVELFQKNNIDIDLILLDLIMPGMDGYETLKTLKTISDRLPPVVALTALSTDSEIKKAEAAGFSDFIAKPFVYDAFLKKINTLLNN